MASTRRLTPWVQAVYTLRFLIDGSRIKQLAVDNALPKSIAYEYLWEGLEVLAACAPTLHDVIDTARAAGDAHVGLDGTLIPANRVKVEDPTEGCDLRYSGKHPLPRHQLPGHLRPRRVPAVDRRSPARPRARLDRHA